MFIAVVGMLRLRERATRLRWRTFKRPLHAALVDRDKRWVRGGLLVAVPRSRSVSRLITGATEVEAPIQLRSIHPAPPGQITFRGKPMQLAGPRESAAEDRLDGGSSREGKRVYYQNCLAVPRRSARRRRDTSPTASVRRRRTSPTTAPSRSSRRATSSGASRRAAPACRAKARPGTRRCRSGRTTSPKTRSGRS